MKILKQVMGEVAHGKRIPKTIILDENGDCHEDCAGNFNHEGERYDGTKCSITQCHKIKGKRARMCLGWEIHKVSKHELKK